MRRKSLSNAKLVVTVESNKATGRIRTVSVFDNRTQEYWHANRIHARGIEWFLGLDHMKETLNWNWKKISVKTALWCSESGKRQKQFERNLLIFIRYSVKI